MELDFANMSFEDFINQLSSFFSLNTLLVRLILALGIFCRTSTRHLFVKVILRFFSILLRKQKRVLMNYWWKHLKSPQKLFYWG